MTRSSTVARRFCTTGALLVTFGVTHAAFASPAYPEQLKAELGLSAVPPCSLCHTPTSNGGIGAVTTPFGKSIVARGLRGAPASDLDAGESPTDAGAPDPSLVAALAKMRSDGVDSDGDGAEDLDELAWGADPNTYDGLKSNPTQSVAYGCSLSPAAAANSALPGLGLFCIFVLLGARTKRGAINVRLRR